MATIPIYQMGSFSRSGETLLLRNLGAHPQIEVVHQILEPDTSEDIELFKFLQTHPHNEINSNHPIVRHRKLKTGQILLLKNAVWTPTWRWQGFILARNVMSVLNSCRVLVTQDDKEGRLHHRNQCNRWARGIDPELLPALQRFDNFQAFAILWNAKMASAYSSGMPVVRYENFVNDPEPHLRKIVAHLGLPWDSSVMTAHEAYPENTFGHGRIKLWQAIHGQSLDSYKVIPEENLDRAYALSVAGMRLYGYDFIEREVKLNDDFDDRFRENCEI